MNNDELDMLSKVYIDSYSNDEIYDISDINIDITLSNQDRINKFFDLVKNPYLIKVSDTIVKIQFSENSSTIQSKLESMICSYN
mgnify:CR=1 FL=1